jgi:hypothetical protein
MKGWIRPRSAWHLVPYWRRVHTFMSTQALTLGSTVLTVQIAIGASKRALLVTLALTVAATLIGALIEQPEVRDDAA